MRKKKLWVDDTKTQKSATQNQRFDIYTNSLKTSSSSSFSLIASSPNTTEEEEDNKEDTKRTIVAFVFCYCFIAEEKVRLTHIVVRHHLLMVENLLVRWTICSRYRSVGGLFRCRAVALWVLSSLSLSLSLSIYHLCTRACISSSLARAARFKIWAWHHHTRHFVLALLTRHETKKQQISRVFFFWLCAMAYIGSLSLSLTQRKNAFLSSCDHTFIDMM